MDEVQRDLITQIGDITIPNLQALVLVIHFRSSQRFTGDVWVLLSIAARVAFTKRLNYERPAANAVTQECLRRVMWSIYRLDKIFSGGIEDLTVADVKKLIPRLGIRARSSDTPPPLGALRTQEKLHRRSKYAYAPEDEEGIDPAVNPQQYIPDEPLAATASDAGIGSETWPFSMPDQGEQGGGYPGRDLLGSAHFFGDSLMPYTLSNPTGSSFEDGDLAFPMDPFNMQMNAYTDANLTPFLAEMEQ
ncbi:hypothetical protein QQZ08_006629 [Neonectria magnoliae]|uniref:Transcription factor domain-containing protein n=1 Tax=Neonectria magnoliae TaxID=2732573 RepID=A0ABR1I057_9HYPO